jgi:hypothetical protein
MKRIRFLLKLIAKLAVLCLVATMAVLQLPELRYDLSEQTPVAVLSPQDLTRNQFTQPTFVAVHGRAHFGIAFTYRRYGLTFTYFTLKPYGLDIVVRTHDRVTDEWTRLDRFLGKLRPFAEQPFSYRIEEIFQEQGGVAIPAGAYFLALDDVPAISGWQIGAFFFSVLLWCALFFLFFFYRGPLFIKPGPPRCCRRPETETSNRQTTRAPQCRQPE